MNDNNNLNIIIVEDDAIIAQLIETDLTDAGHLVVDIVHRGDKAWPSIVKYNPDLILLDIDLGSDIDGISIGKKLKDKQNIPFIYLTAFSDRATLLRARVTEPCGYLVKPYKPNDLHAAITIGLFNYQNRIANKEMTIERLNDLSSGKLTIREFEIVQEITTGLTNAQIAANQFLSLHTIKWHLQNIYSKLGVKNRTSLVKLVLEAV